MYGVVLAGQGRHPSPPLSTAFLISTCCFTSVFVRLFSLEMVHLGTEKCTIEAKDTSVEPVVIILLCVLVVCHCFSPFLFKKSVTYLN